MSPKMKEALESITAVGQEGAYRKNWHGATVAALLRSGAIETVPGDSDMVRVPKTSAESAMVTVGLPDVGDLLIHRDDTGNTESWEGVVESVVTDHHEGPLVRLRSTWASVILWSDWAHRVTVTADTALAYYVPQWIGEAEKEAYATATDIHEACGRPTKDHCAYCDTCVCGCPVADTIAATDGGIHAECGKPLADHCTGCDECPRVPGPCWCLSTVDAEDDGRPVADEPVIIVEGSTAPGFVIDFGPEVTEREVTRREAWSIVKRLEYAGVHVPDRLGMVDEVMSGVASYPRTPDEWRHVERCGPAGHCSCPVPEMDAALTAVSPIYRVHGQGDRDHHLVSVDPVTVTLRPVDGGLDWTYVIGDVYRVDGVPLLTVADVVTLMSPEEAVSLRHAGERGWARRNKDTRSRRRRYARKGH